MLIPVCLVLLVFEGTTTEFSNDVRIYGKWTARKKNNQNQSLRANDDIKHQIQFQGHIGKTNQAQYQ